MILLNNIHIIYKIYNKKMKLIKNKILKIL